MIRLILLLLLLILTMRLPSQEPESQILRLAPNLMMAILLSHLTWLMLSIPAQPSPFV